MKIRLPWEWFACAVTAALLVAIPVLLVRALGWWTPVVVVAFVGAAGSRAAWRHARLLKRFRAQYQPLGKDLVLVYSNSPHWNDYIEANWLPKWGMRAVVVNLTRRNEWRRETSPEAQLLRGRREASHPFAVVIPRNGWEKYFWFRAAFQKRKFGDGIPLASMEAELEQALARASARDA